MDDIIKLLPPMLTGEELKKKLQIIPEPFNNINASSAERLIGLSLFDLYFPSPMSEEIYTRLYLALVRSLHNKTGKNATIQRNLNHKYINGQEPRSVLGVNSLQSFSILGVPGVGKTSAVMRAISVITESRLIELKDPHTTVIQFLLVECPFDGSIKQLLIEILRQVDYILGTDYYIKAMKNRITTDVLIGMVSQVALNHIGVLIVDEIQNVVGNNNGRNLVAALTQIINSCSGISLCFCGTPEVEAFFEGAMHLSRRAMGLSFGPVENGQFFYDFCQVLFDYQFTEGKMECTDSVEEWLFEHSGGIIALVITLFRRAQEMAITRQIKAIDIELLNEAYKEEMKMMHTFVAPTILKLKKVKASKPEPVEPMEISAVDEEKVITSVAAKAKANGQEMLELLKKRISVLEV